MYKKIAVGLVLWVSSFAYADPNWLYTIRPGENIWTICKKYTDYSRCWLELADLNNVERTRRMKPGQQIAIPMQWLKNKPIAVSVSFVAGEVLVQRDATSKFQPAIVGQTLPVGAVVKTGKGSATLGFADGSLLQVEAETIIALDTVSNFDGQNIVDSSVRLQRGAVKAKVKPRASGRFYIHTPAAVASVRGTEYRVSADDSAALTRSEVLTGSIELANQFGAEEVSQGFASFASANVAPIEPVKLLDPPQLELPEGNVSLPYAISWQPLVGAGNYRVSLNEDGNDDAVFLRANSGETRYSINDLPLACYGIKVSGIDKNNFIGIPAVGRLCFVETIDAPVLSLKELKHKDILTWPRLEGVNEFIVQTSLSPDFSMLLSEQRSKSNSIQIENPELVYIRIAAVGDAGQLSEFSEVAVKQAKSKPWWIAAPVALALLFAL